MNSRIDKIRQILADQDNKQNRTSDNKGGFDTIFPFWNMKSGDSSTVRFLPDGNTDNALPWVESQQITLDFPGVIGQHGDRTIRVKVPCVEMWGLSCPMLGHVRKEKWFDDKDTEALGRKYWKKYSYVMQGFIIEDGLGESESPENPIRRFIFGKQIFNMVRSGYADPELDDSVDDYENGIDFIIQTESSGQYNNYTQSKFKRRTRSLTPEERAAIEEYGLSRLEDFLPKKPTDVESQTLYEMFLASVEGEYYDPDKWGHLPWRPRGVEFGTPKAEKVDVVVTPVVTTAEKPEVKAETPDKIDTKQQTADILAKIRGKM